MRILVSKKLSVENMIEKYFKLDQFVTLALNENQLKQYYSNSKANFDIENENNFKGYNDIKAISVFSSNTNIFQGMKKDDILSKSLEKLNEQYDLVKKNKFT